MSGPAPDPSILDGARAVTVTEPTVILSLDLEGDYNGPRRDGLAGLPRLLDELRRAEVPLTAFVEGRFFVEEPAVIDQLIEANVDVQLHCWNHTDPGDTPDTLARSVEAYTTRMGRRPTGYRANTYRLDRALHDALVDQGFAWDSSVLPATGLGGWPVTPADAWRLSSGLWELPVAAWRGIPFSPPITQSYRLLMGPWAESLIEAAARPPSLLVYDAHMVDLVRTNSLRTAPLSWLLKAAYAASWRFGRTDSFDRLTEFVDRYRTRGYAFVTASAQVNALAQSSDD